MSIQTELTRLTTAKNAIVSAIEGKGVDVPSGTKLDALAALIESIEAGGGKIHIEDRTMASNVGEVTITHNFGEKPNIVAQLLINTTSGKYTKKARLGLGFVNADGTSVGSTSYNDSSSSYLAINSGIPIRTPFDTNITGEKCKFCAAGINIGGIYYYAGDTYRFVLIGGLQL